MDPVALVKRHQQLRTARQSHVEDIWRACFDHTYPARGSQLYLGGSTAGTYNASLGNAATKQAELMDATGTDSARVLASALVSALVPSNSRWFELEIDDADDEGRQWLEDSAETIWRNIHASNFDAVVYEAMLDQVCAGMGPLFVDESPDGGYRFTHWPLSQCYFASSQPGGPVDVVHRELAMTGEQALREYGDALSDQAKGKAQAKPDDPLQFVWALYPRPLEMQAPPFAKGLPYASCHVELQTRKLVRESGYHELPAIVPRWQVLPDSVYAIGPVFEALPDLRTLNELVRLQMMGMDLAVAGMWIAADDGVLNPRTVKIGPRKIIVANDVNSMKELKSSGNLQASLMEIERLQRAIRRSLMADQLTPQDGPAMTATEVHVRVELIRQLLGPLYGRMQSEFLQPLVARCFGLAYRAGVLAPPPESLRGRTWRLKYVSPLARAQRMVEVSAMDRYEQSLAAIAAIRPEVLDNYDWDEAARAKGEALGVPQRLLVDVAQRDAARTAAQEQAAAAQQAATMQAMSNPDNQAPMASAAQMMR